MRKSFLAKLLELAIDTFYGVPDNKIKKLVPLPIKNESKKPRSISRGTEVVIASIVEAQVECQNFSNAPPTAQPILDEIVDLSTFQLNVVDIVGEASYYRQIKDICNGEELMWQKTVDIETILFLENNNTFDALAVRVDVQGRTVGYLSREYARRFRRWMKRHDFSENKAKTTGTVSGFDSESGHRYSISILLPIRPNF